MEVILLKDVDRLGKAGATVKVKDGFARNLLIPGGSAVLANAANLKRLERAKQNKIAKLEASKKEAEELKEKLSAISLTLPVLTKDEDEKLYGGITTIDVARALKEEGFNIDKNAVLLEEPIKTLGIYEIAIKLHPEVEAKVKTWVVKK